MLLTVAHVGGRAAGGAQFLIGPLLFLVLAGFLIFMFVRVSRRHGPWMAPASRGLTVLEERYAGGEIDRDEYLAKREDLAAWSRKRDKKK